MKDEYDYSDLKQKERKIKQPQSDEGSFFDPNANQMKVRSLIQILF